VIPRMVARLSNRITLTPYDLEFFEKATDRAIKVRRGELIQIAGETAGRAFFLESGWAMTFSDFPDGSRQSRRLHFAGDILGLPSMAMNHHAENIEAITDVVVAPFPKASVATLLEEHPRLAAIMFIFAQEERITSGDRLCSISRLPCKGRVAFLLLDVLTRLRAADPSVNSSFEMHLTREQMGEITGMTPVHASRMWSELIAEGSISYERPFVTIEDESRLEAISNFVNRSLDLDLSWLPESDGALAS
jgi:CRP/FNR family transcriptional regulator, anaerobic regulatory protein